MRHELNIMIFFNSRITPDICPVTLQDASPSGITRASEPSPDSPTHFLALPTEIRLQIHYYYLISLNIPERLFTHLTMLGYWSDGSGVVTRYDDRGNNLGRRISKPLLSLLLLNHQIRLEVEEVLYRDFVFCIHPSLSSVDALRDFYSNKGKGARPASRLRNIQINLSLNSRFWHAPPLWVFEKWRVALRWLSTSLPELQTVGLAVDYVPPTGADKRTKKEMLDLILSFARIFKTVKNFSLRFADIQYDQYGYIAPVSSELLEEEKLLLRLRDEENLIWHRVAMHFHDPSSELYSVIGLQARYERLKARQQRAEMEAEYLERLKEEN
jgi:hypothetical protein